MTSAYSQLYFGLAGAIVLVYLVIVVNFQSWLDPFIIITALPGALTGIAWMLFLTRTTISVQALMGTIMCIGVATANSILVVSFATEQMQQGKDAITQKRIEDRYHLLIKASAIISGLQACLDFENGGHIAKVLYNFYSDVGGRIFSIHRTNSLQTCDEVIADVKKMRDVWHEIDQSAATADSEEPPVAEHAAEKLASAAESDDASFSA